MRTLLLCLPLSLLLPTGLWACDGEKPAGDARSGEQRGPEASVQPSLRAEQVLKACVIIASCQPQGGVTACLDAFYRQGRLGSPSSFACLDRTSGCAGMSSCLGLSPLHGAPCDVGKKRLCVDADTLLTCDDADGVRVACKQLFGVGCTAGAGTAACGSGATCSGPTCRGEYLVGCPGGIESYSQVCAADQLTCKEGQCVGPGEPCTASQCDGSIASLCVGLYRRRVDCAALGAGLGCQPSAAGGSVRCMQGGECDPDTALGKETCEGDTLVVCHAGKLTRVDCKALGFSGCSTMRHACAS